MRSYSEHMKKSRNSVADSTVPETEVPCTLSQATVLNNILIWDNSR